MKHLKKFEGFMDIFTNDKVIDFTNNVTGRNKKNEKLIKKIKNFFIKNKLSKTKVPIYFLKSIIY